MLCKPAAGLWNAGIELVCWSENVLIDFLPLLGVGSFSLCYSSPLLTVVVYSGFIDVLLALCPGLVLWRAAVKP